MFSATKCEMAERDDLIHNILSDSTAAAAAAAVFVHSIITRRSRQCQDAHQSDNVEVPTPFSLPVCPCTSHANTHISQIVIRRY